MNIEHVGLNVPDPVAFSAWYCLHLGFRVVRHLPEPHQTHFLCDANGGIVEVYRNPPDDVPDYPSMDPLQLHLAFVSGDPTEDSERLAAAGASMVGETRLADGCHLVMMRDPWGIAIQLCKRPKALGSS